MPSATTEYGQLLCPLPGHACEADRELYAEHLAAVPLCEAPDMRDLRSVPVDYSAKAAVATSWKVVCGHGHVVMASRGEETAEPINPRVLAAVLESLRLLAPDEVTPDPCPYCGSWQVRDVPENADSELAGTCVCGDCGWNDRDGHPLL